MQSRLSCVACETQIYIYGTLWGAVVDKSKKHIINVCKIFEINYIFNEKCYSFKERHWEIEKCYIIKENVKQKSLFCWTFIEN